MTDVQEFEVKPTHASDIQTLTPEAVERIRLPWDTRYSQRELHRISTTSPNLSVWNPQSGEYLIGGLWRHRPDIATIIDINGVESTIPLICRFSEQAFELGFSVALISEYAESRKAEFYAKAGFEPIEDIVIYELGGLRRPRINDVRLQFERIGYRDSEEKKKLIKLDNLAFPWLWRNSDAEFQNYMEAPGVSIWVSSDEQGEFLAYVGITALRSWGHLDRIAVRPDRQGEGLGKQALDFAIARLVQEGTRRIGLSTQANNTVSRKLYESSGFRRSSCQDYRLWGQWLKQRNVDTKDR